LPALMADSDVEIGQPGGSSGGEKGVRRKRGGRALKGRLAGVHCCTGEVGEVGVVGACSRKKTVGG
jgi:hypothetical protein